MKVMDGLLYSKDHEWIKVEGSKVYIGITDYAQNALGDIVYVELPEEDDELDREDTFGVIESVKAASDAYMPVSGTIVEANEELDDEPGLLNADAFKHWIIAVELSNTSELDDLMDADAYRELISKED